MTSIEAAQLYIQAEQQEQQRRYEDMATFDMDGLAKSGLARWAGFDFDMVVHHNRIILIDKTTGLKTTCLYTQPMDDKTGKRIFRALVRLKTMHDRALDTRQA